MDAIVDSSAQLPGMNLAILLVLVQMMDYQPVQLGVGAIGQGGKGHPLGG